MVAFVVGCSAADNGTSSSRGVGDGRSSDPGLASGDGSACHPGEVDTYQPAFYHSAAPAWRGVCVIGGPSGSGQDRGFFDACLTGDATPEQCAAFRSNRANDECANCIQTAQDARFYGPLINNRGTFITTNVAGCIELTDLRAISCAKALQARGGCELWACQANCPVHDQSSRAAYDSCAVQADLKGCEAYDVTAACSSVNADAGPSATCLLPSFVDYYYAVVPLFCGIRDEDAGPIVDASPDVVAETSSVAAPDARAPSSDGAGPDAYVDAHEDGSVDARADAFADALADVLADASAGARADGSMDAGADAPLDAPQDASVDVPVGTAGDAAADGATD